MARENDEMPSSDRERALRAKVMRGPNGSGGLEPFLGELERASGRARRVGTDPEKVERDLAKLVLTLIELLRQLLERQALRRVEAGSLTDEEVERLGQTFLKLEARLEELKMTFGLEDEDLNLNLGPLGHLL